jgi:hypothetical protein
VPVVFLHPICDRPPWPPQLLRPTFGRSGEHHVAARAPKVRATAAITLHRNLCGCASLGFRQIAIWRSTARERRDADGRPSDGKIKDARCAPVGEWKKAIGSACCNKARFWLAACDLAQTYASSWSPAPRRLRRAMIAWSEPLPDDRKPVKARATRVWLRRLADLTGSRPPGSLASKRSWLPVGGVALVAMPVEIAA